MKQKLIFDYNTESTEYIEDITNREHSICSLLDKKYLKTTSTSSCLPSASEIDVARHFTNLSRKTYGIDNGIYPLGSCTMKYNPKINEEIAYLDNFCTIHPYAEYELIQGGLKILYELENLLAEISGMDCVSLHPCAGAHGEFAGLLIIDAYHKKNGEKRDIVLVPNSAHGTNPASAAVLGKRIIEIKCNEKGSIDISHLKQVLNDSVSALMLTNPNTLGFFEENIIEIEKLVHKYGTLLYYDGANLNPLLGIIRPGDMGFDLMHFNLHKTFSTPHGGGGPGAGPIAVKNFLKEFLPVPRIIYDENKYVLKNDYANSIGKIRPFLGNISVLIKAYAYIISLGTKGLKQVAEISILNANYVLLELKKLFHYPFSDKKCWHEFVVSAKKYAEQGIKALDIAKRMIDYGIHPPTIYFPLNVQEAMMFEPTETESKESLDKLIEILKQIVYEIQTNPDIVKSATNKGNIGRLDEVKAVKELDIVNQNV